MAARFKIGLNDAFLKIALLIVGVSSYFTFKIDAQHIGQRKILARRTLGPETSAGFPEFGPGRTRDYDIFGPSG